MIFESFFNVSGRNFYKRPFSRHNMVEKGKKEKGQADRKVTPCAFLPWVDRVGGRPPDGRRPVVRRPTDGRRTVVRPDVRAARVSSAAPKKKSFDRGGPVWPPRSNVTNDRLGGGVWGGFAPPAKIRGVWGAAPPSQNRKKKTFFLFFEKSVLKSRFSGTVKHASHM